MDSTRKKVLFFSVFVLLVLISGVSYSFMSTNRGGLKDLIRYHGHSEKQNSNPNSDQRPETSPHGNFLEAKYDRSAVSVADQLVRELQESYAPTIHRKRTQASLYGIRNSIAGSKPDAMLFFHSVLERAFPDYAEEITDTLDKLATYYQWLSENQRMLSQMSDDSRLAALWEKRISLFGEDAHDIWEDEMSPTDARKAKFEKTVALIDASSDMSIEEKLDTYRNTLRELYEGAPEAFQLAQPAMMTKAFFSIGSIQDELKQMDSDQRQMTINMIRREMGFSQQQVEKMEQLDAKRNGRWEKGLKYMAERENAVAEFEGGLLAEKLKELRQNYFGIEAKTIEKEEERDGFFRFRRPRYYGRN